MVHHSEVIYTEAIYACQILFIVRVFPFPNLPFKTPLLLLGLPVRLIALNTSLLVGTIKLLASVLDHDLISLSRFYYDTARFTIGSSNGFAASSSGIFCPTKMSPTGSI